MPPSPENRGSVHVRAGWAWAAVRPHARPKHASPVRPHNPHAAVQVEAHARRRLEPLCRYITRPAPSNERVQLNSAGLVELKLKTQRRDGTTHLVMWPAGIHAATSGAGAAAEAATDELPG